MRPRTLFFLADPGDGNGTPPPPESGHPAAAAAVAGQRTEAEVRAEIKKVAETPATTVKDERWIETRISELENELNDLRRLKARPAAVPPAAPAKPGKNFLEKFMDGDEDED